MKIRTGSLAKRCYRLALILPAIALIIGNAQGQTAEFTYQGRLTDAGNPATGIYDFQFKLFDSATVGTGAQQGGTITQPIVDVTNGAFTVELDFGPGVFDGSARFLEVALRPAGSSDPYTVLSPRQPIGASPYAVRSATAAAADTATNAAQLGGLTAAGFIQNTTSQQSATNFNIGGTGRANILSAATQFDLGGFRVLSQPGPCCNLFAGRFAGSNTTGANNSFFGIAAGIANTTGFNNSFFGHGAGLTNTTGANNSFFGDDAGRDVTGNGNSSFGKRAAGVAGGSGDNNTFIGIETDFNLNGQTGSNNTLLGANSKVVFTTSGQQVNFATAIGAGAVVNSSNSVVLGRNVDTVRIPGAVNVTGPFIGNVLVGGNLGIGTNAPATKLHINGAEEGIRIQGPTTGDANLAYVGFNDSTGERFGFVGDASAVNKSVYLFSVGDVVLRTAAGDGLVLDSTGSVAMSGGTGSIPGTHVAAQTFNNGVYRGLFVPVLILSEQGFFNAFPASPIRACIRNFVSVGNVNGVALTQCIPTSSSSVSNKTDVQPFSNGLDIIERLNPVSFKWRKDARSDFGLNAEDVAEVEPLLVTCNAKGEVEDVKQENLMVLFINAIKEQQRQIARQQSEIDSLKRLICLHHPDADVCKQTRSSGRAPE